MPCLGAYAPSGIQTHDLLMTSREHKPIHRSAPECRSVVLTKRCTYPLHAIGCSSRGPPPPSPNIPGNIPHCGLKVIQTSVCPSASSNKWMTMQTTFCTVWFNVSMDKKMTVLGCTCLFFFLFPSFFQICFECSGEMSCFPHHLGDCSILQ